MTTLLDGNVLVALVVSDHTHHSRATEWFARSRRRFATCPVTQGTLVRLLIRGGARPDDAFAALETIVAHRRHDFWTDDIGYDAVDRRGLMGHRQVTDAYLAALARHRGGRLATFDEGLAALHTDVAGLVPPVG